ncbi:hypothetical protein DOTSEDRAFT_72910 [Dothistroma septosporum NZE10]|uniref:Inheritance of peroxisomes protein 1 n=1 Tax=Dothistroma septosporum (strain NZE10 / CBS 128990) TaxID=675120 RepID=N1PH62_DOTSN|nr:hypothetical protein DOTSEDRAFT_72910 [Dothistroma septosporum NZE10]
MSTTAPKTPEQTPRKFALNRSFTLPSKIATTSRATPTAEIGAAEGIETLYTHANAKVIKFTTSGTSRPGSSAGTPSPGGAQGQQGTLPWATLTEQTLAAGPLEIYRVPGSVSFLHSGSLLHAILPRSNCWCVDGVSKFAMRVLPATYYRIELSGESAEDLEKVEEFKECLKKVLFYERTACPFARTFSVDLPAEPEMKVRKKVKSHGRAKKWKMERAYSWKPEDGEEPLGRGSESSGSATDSDVEGSSSAEDTIPEVTKVADDLEQMRLNTPTRPSVRERAMGINMRSVTAPPHLSLQGTPPPPSRLRESLAPEPSERSRSRSPQQEPGALNPTTLRPFQAIPTDMPPSPPDSSAGLDYVDHPPRLVASTLPSKLDHALDKVTEHGKGREDAAQEPEHGLDIGANSEAEDDTRAPIVRTEHAEQHISIHDGARDGVLTEGENGTIHDEHDGLAYGRGESILDDSVLTTEVEAGDTVLELESGVTDGWLDDATSQQEPIPEEPPKDDPYAQIQARIQARRSIGGTTTSFAPNTKGPTRRSSSTTVSTASLSSKRSDLSRRSHSSQQQQAFATALVRKACAVFLGPPASLVAIMLRIAARFARGAFPFFESPRGMARKVPGSFDLAGSDVEDLDGLDYDDGEWGEDDFGVPIRSPIRLRAMEEESARTLSRESGSGVNVRERKRWDVAAGA